MPARTCQLTDFRTTDDAHPTDTGYSHLRRVFYDSSGYERIGH
jgi:hypothetical protein